MLGQLIREHRLRCGLSKANLARMIDVSSTTIANIETGRNTSIPVNRWDTLLRALPTMTHADLYGAHLHDKGIELEFTPSLGDTYMILDDPCRCVFSLENLRILVRINGCTEYIYAVVINDHRAKAFKVPCS